MDDDDDVEEQCGHTRKGGVRTGVREGRERGEKKKKRRQSYKSRGHEGVNKDEGRADHWGAVGEWPGVVV